MLHTAQSVSRPQIRPWIPGNQVGERTARAEPQAPAAAEPVTVPLVFPRGLLAFPEAQQFLLRPLGDTRLPQVLLLEGLGAQAPRFLVMGPRAAGAELPAMETCIAARRLGVDPDHAHWFLIVTVDWNRERPNFYANGRAPLLIDSRQRLGWQAVLGEEARSLRGPAPFPRL